MTDTTTATKNPIRVCNDCGRTGRHGFIAAGERLYQCARRRFCQWRAEGRAINQGWR